MDDQWEETRAAIELRSSIANGSKQLSGRVEQAEIVSREQAEVASWGTDRERESAEYRA